MTKITVPTPEGNKDIDTLVFASHREDAFEQLDAIETAKEKLKGIFADVAEATGLKKGVITKYLKQKHADKVRASIAEGKTFSALDEALA